MRRKWLHVTLVLALFLALLPVPAGLALPSQEGVTFLPKAGAMVPLSPAYTPAVLKGLTVHKDNPFLFDFILDVGQDSRDDAALKAEGEKLIRYFLASMAIPEQDLWVNLSPYEKDRTVPAVLGMTEMGRDLLAQDYLLKQVTASLINPQKTIGQNFWSRIYDQAKEKFGQAPVPVSTFNKVWIMADRAEVVEHNQSALVVNSHLKVMLEEDYLALSKNAPTALVTKDSSLKNVYRDVILPEIEKEVNAGKTFANLRQIFNSLILATWYKKSLKQSMLNQAYADKAKVSGIQLDDPEVNRKIYQQYVQAYKRGVFNFIQDGPPQEVSPRKYFSGGVVANVSQAMTVRRHFDQAMLRVKNPLGNFRIFRTEMRNRPVKLIDNLGVGARDILTEIVPPQIRVEGIAKTADVSVILRAVDTFIAKVPQGSFQLGKGEVFLRGTGYAVVRSLLLQAPEASVLQEDERNPFTFRVQVKNREILQSWLQKLKQALEKQSFEDTEIQGASFEPAKLQANLEERLLLNVSTVEVVGEFSQWLQNIQGSLEGLNGPLVVDTAGGAEFVSKQEVVFARIPVETYHQDSSKWKIFFWALNQVAAIESDLYQVGAKIMGNDILAYTTYSNLSNFRRHLDSLIEDIKHFATHAHDEDVELNRTILKAESLERFSYNAAMRAGRDSGPDAILAATLSILEAVRTMELVEKALTRAWDNKMPSWIIITTKPNTDEKQFTEGLQNRIKEMEIPGGLSISLEKGRGKSSPAGTYYLTFSRQNAWQLMNTTAKTVLNRHRSALASINKETLFSLDGPHQPKSSGSAAMAANGGIDLKAFDLNLRKQGMGVDMTVDRALISEIQRRGVDFLVPEIDSIMPASAEWFKKSFVD